MKNKEFYSVEHAHAYLSSSVIQYDGEPVYIYEVVPQRGEGFIARYRAVGSKWDVEAANLKDSKWDMTPVPLGFVNYEAWGSIIMAIGVARLPHRAWKIGLTSGNMAVNPIFDIPGLPSSRDLVFQRFLRNTIVGEYPKYPAVLDWANRTGVQNGAKAFSRDYALTTTMALHHRLHRSAVGSVNPDNGNVDLKDEYKYLSETLMRDMG